jgi:hypothetical protein
MGAEEKEQVQRELKASIIGFASNIIIGEEFWGVTSAALTGDRNVNARNEHRAKGFGEARLC